MGWGLSSTGFYYWVRVFFFFSSDSRPPLNFRAELEKIREQRDVTLAEHVTECMLGLGLARMSKDRTFLVCLAVHLKGETATWRRTRRAAHRA